MVRLLQSARLGSILVGFVAVIAVVVGLQSVLVSRSVEQIRVGGPKFDAVILSKDMVAEPRFMAGLNADGDAARDLAMISQDRLVIYVGRDQETH